MFFPLRPLVNPLVQKGFFPLCKFQIGLRWWHYLARIFVINTLHQITFGSLPWHNGMTAFLERRRSTFVSIQSQFRFSTTWVGTVAQITILYQYGFYVKIKIDHFR